MAVRSLLCWRAAAAALSVLLVGVMISYLHNPSRMASQPIERPAPAERRAPQQPAPADLAAVAQKPTAADLDAWQVRALGSESLSEQLAQLERTDPHLRSLAVGTMTHAVLEP